MKAIINFHTKKLLKRDEQEPSSSDLTLDEYQRLIATRYRDMLVHWLAFAHAQAKAAQQQYPSIPNWEFRHRVFDTPENPSQEIFWWSRLVSEKFPSSGILLSGAVDGMVLGDTGEPLEAREKRSIEP
jgi:hypothetical protein